MRAATHERMAELGIDLDLERPELLMWRHERGDFAAWCRGELDGALLVVSADGGLPETCWPNHEFTCPLHVGVVHYDVAAAGSVNWDPLATPPQHDLADVLRRRVSKAGFEVEDCELAPQEALAL